jgi:AraC family transcriptional activator of pobA
MSAEVKSIRFDRIKYGCHLLADACEVRSIPGFIKTALPHRLAFYEVALVTAGHGALALDGLPVEVAPYRVCITAPGEVRRWSVDGARLDGLLAFFEPELFDGEEPAAALLHALPLFAAPARHRSFALGRQPFERMTDIIGAMTDELRSPDAHTPRMLRARTEELLIALQRASGLREPRSGRRAGSVAQRFAVLVEERFRRGEPVSSYAEALGTSVRHLNLCVRASTGLTASETLRSRIDLEARRLLLGSRLSVSAIAEALGFSDTPYFIRFFKRRAGTAPGAFRAAQQSPVFDRPRPLSARLP